MKKKRKRKTLGDTQAMAFRVARVQANAGNCPLALDWLAQGFEQRGHAGGGSTKSGEESRAAVAAFKARCLR